MIRLGDFSLVFSGDAGSLGADSWNWGFLEDGAFSSQRAVGGAGGGGELGVVVVESGVSDFSGA